MESNLKDAGLGFAGLSAVLIFCIFSGGFSFLQPWFIWPAVVFVLLGLSRKVRFDESLWSRVFSLDVAWLLAIPLAFVADHSKQINGGWVCFS